MTSDVFEFLIRGHEKVIGHYKFLLASQGLSPCLRSTIKQKLESEVTAQRRLIEQEARTLHKPSIRELGEGP